MLFNFAVYSSVFYSAQKVLSYLWSQTTKVKKIYKRKYMYCTIIIFFNTIHKNTIMQSITCVFDGERCEDELFLRCKVLSSVFWSHNISIPLHSILLICQVQCLAIVTFNLKLLQGLQLTCTTTVSYSNTALSLCSDR